jgi:RNA polymerase sigma factor (sigma-70 family)
MSRLYTPGTFFAINLMKAADQTIGESPSLLVERIRAGDATAEEDFVKAYGKRIFLIASVRTRDREAARDIAQEVLVAVLLALRAGQVREAEKLPAFVQGTARNLINNYLRRVSRRAETDLDAIAIPGPDPMEEIETTERQQIVRRELTGYSVQDQQILLLSMVDGHSLTVVAERLGLSHDAVRARKSRLLRRITKKVKRLSQK